MMRGRFALQGLIGLLVAGLVATAAPAQEEPDVLAQTIQQGLEDVAFQARVAPDSAEEELDRQRGRLEDLASAAPDHPMLPSLERRIEELEEDIASVREAMPDTGDAGSRTMMGPLQAPVEVRRQLRDVESLQTRADREMMRGERESAAELLAESESLIESIEAEYGDQIPQGYATLIVAKERAAALRDQLEARAADD